MSKAFFLSPTGIESGLTTITYGLVYALERIGVRVGVFQPIDYQLSHEDNSAYFAKMLNKQTSAETISLSEAQTLMSENKSGLLMEKIIGNYQIAAEHSDIVVVEGIPNDRSQAYNTRLNIEIARNLNAEVILVADPQGAPADTLMKQLKVSAS